MSIKTLFPFSDAVTRNTLTCLDAQSIFTLRTVSKGARRAAMDEILFRTLLGNTASPERSFCNQWDELQRPRYNRAQNLCFVRTFTNEYTVAACSFSRDGKEMQSVDANPSIYAPKIRDRTTGTLLRTLDTAEKFVKEEIPSRIFAFHPNGKEYLHVDKDTLEIWDKATQIVRLRIFHGDPIWNAVYSPNGSEILAASSDRTLNIWDSENGNLIRSFLGNKDIVSFCGYSPDGKEIFSLSKEIIKIWNRSTGQCLRTFTAHEELGCCSFSPDGKEFLLGTKDHNLYAWDKVTGSRLYTLRGHVGPVTCCAFSSDDKEILSGSMDHTLKAWDFSLSPEQLLLRIAADMSIDNFKRLPDHVRNAIFGHLYHVMQPQGETPHNFGELAFYGNATNDQRREAIYRYLRATTLRTLPLDQGSASAQERLNALPESLRNSLK